MRSQIRFVAAVVLGTLIVSPAVIAAKADVESGKILQAFRGLVLSAPQPCTSDPCMVTVSINYVSTGGQTLCYATFPVSLTFVNTTSANPIKTIIWTIDPGTINPVGSSVEFHKTRGILVVDRGQGQIVPDDERTDAHTYSAINKHRKKDTATYVPVILYRTNPALAPSLCATADPQIVNN
jgi:hypothetical protein